VTADYRAQEHRGHSPPSWPQALGRTRSGVVRSLRHRRREIPVCYSILQALGLRENDGGVCGIDTQLRPHLFNLEECCSVVRNATSHLTGLDIP